jgi:hypothetical protein
VTLIELDNRRWRDLRLQVLAEDPDICCWCGHPWTNAVNHNYPRDRYPELTLVRSNLSRIHGIEGCPLCPRKPNGKLRACNSELGPRILFVEAWPPTQGSREW